jgi:hypothetical protein
MIYLKIYNTFENKELIAEKFSSPNRIVCKFRDRAFYSKSKYTSTSLLKAMNIAIGNICHIPIATVL